MSEPTTGDPPLLELSGVTRIYGAGEAQVTALDTVDLRIAKGEFVAVMGPSGSGKSTCMNILGCLDAPTRGSYRFEGREVAALSRDERAQLRRHRLGFVFQGFNLLNRTSAVENVELPLIYQRVPRKVRRERAMAALEAVGLEGREHHTPGELSGGQQQRVAIARAIVTEPAVLLADEPTGNLDTTRGKEVMELIARFNVELGISVLLVTHEAYIAAYAHRTVLFRDGRIVEGSRSAA